MTRLPGWDRALECTRALLDRKAYVLVVLETGKVSSIAVFFVIWSGRSVMQSGLRGSKTKRNGNATVA